MRYIAPALLSLAALVAAQSTDCVTRYESCLTTKAEPECNSELTQCKDSCAKGLDTCNQSGSDSKTCQSSYNSCLNIFPIIPGGSDCVAKFIKCSNSGQSADSCNAQNAVCKDSCTNINSACLSSGSADQAGCSKQYNQCYYSTEDTIEIDCISKYQTCLASGKSVSDCNVVLKSCKDSCTTIQATCLVSGTADSSFCSDLTNKCYYNGSKWTQTDCASSFASCKSSGKADLARTPTSLPALLSVRPVTVHLPTPLETLTLPPLSAQRSQFLLAATLTPTALLATTLLPPTLLPPTLALPTRLASLPWPVSLPWPLTFCR